MTSMAMVLLLALAGGAAAQLDHGQKLFQAGDVAGALKEFDAAAKADPKDPRGPYLRGVALEKKGDAAAHFNLGLLRDGEDKHAEAVTAYRQAVKLRPDDPAIHLNLGAALRRSGDLDGAITELQFATRMAPKDAVAWSNLGLMYSDKKAYDEA